MINNICMCFVFTNNYLIQILEDQQEGQQEDQQEDQQEVHQQQIQVEMVELDLMIHTIYAK